MAKLIYRIKVLCVRVCVSNRGVGTQTVRPLRLKFAMEDHIHTPEVIGYLWVGYPVPRVRGA